MSTTKPKTSTELDSDARIKNTIQTLASNTHVAYWDIIRDIVRGKQEENKTDEHYKDLIEKEFTAAFGEEGAKTRKSTISKILKIGSKAKQADLKRWTNKNISIDAAYVEVTATPPKPEPTKPQPTSWTAPTMGTEAEIAKQNADLEVTNRAVQEAVGAQKAAQPIPEPPAGKATPTVNLHNPVPAFAAWIMKRESLFLDLIQMLVEQKGLTVEMVTYTVKQGLKVNPRFSISIVEILLQYEEFRDRVVDFINDHPSQFDLDLDTKESRSTKHKPKDDYAEVESQTRME